MGTGEMLHAELPADQLAERIFDFGMSRDGGFSPSGGIDPEVVLLAVSVEVATRF
jgi:hypothetical protein